ncbi:hypothetical protein G6O69_29975 [Pseudenhygromyxa sp. WMMC2535]|uniref:hypothetical protein n=1 Tax=Pseudenhygromyxa sp. WMMC2535 TaxID=2712867 RepID=UPI001555EE1F|nr:hypothetical protein [Pseudenhygromyxa sp. WMMC2535]NVB42089.1 hypothetical protein [Pseudenhygromyxa sp. WMMC2535]
MPRQSALVAWLAVGSLQLACSGAGAELRVEPKVARVGDTLRIQGEGFSGHGGVIVLVAARPASGVVIAADGLIRAQLTEDIEPGPATIELVFSDGEVRSVEDALIIEARALELRPRPE